MKNKLILLACVLALTLATTNSVQAQKWVTYTTANSQLPGPDVRVVTFDPSGNAWIGTNSNGLAKFDGTTWTGYGDSTGILPGSYYQALAWFENKLWVGSGNGSGTVTFDPATATATTFTPNTNSSDVRWLATDNKGQIWAATGAGLSVLRTTNLWNTYTKLSVTGTNFPYDGISTVAPDVNGNVWVGFDFANGFVKMNGTTGVGTLIDATTYPNFPNDYVKVIAVDGNGTVWAGTSTASGLVKFDGSSITVYSQATDPGWISNNINAINTDACGHVWIGTDAGAARLDGNTWTQFNSANSPLTNNTVNNIAVDGQGHVWFGTAEGLSEYKPLPQVVSLNYPSNAANVTTDTLTATWYGDCPGIARYSFEIADNASFTNSTIDTALTTFPGMPSKHLSNLKDKTTYYWRVKAENDAGYGPLASVQSFSVNIASGVWDNGRALANGLSLDPSFPNPASGVASINYTLSAAGEVEIGIYNTAGSEVARVFSGRSGAGSHQVSFNGSTLANGSYFCRLSSAQFGKIVRPMTIAH